MDTLELLEEAANRAENLALIQDSDDLFKSIGLEDEDIVHDFCRFQALEILRIRMMMAKGPVTSLETVSTVAVMFGITVGYQLALLRETHEE